MSYPVVLWHFIANPHPISVEEISTLAPQAILVPATSAANNADPLVRGRPVRRRARTVS